MLGSRRPDIPVLVVQSAQSGGSLNAIPGIDFSKYPQIMAAPPVTTPAEYFALTRILLAPSVWEEPFGRVAAESMINGVPPIVGTRRAPGRRGRRLRRWRRRPCHPDSRLDDRSHDHTPSEQEVEPWYEAVCSLWDDDALYHAMAARARQLASERYSEAVSREQHVKYFTSLKAGRSPIAP
jgi:glycosyltransferase involved in cell wall biosynthesis